MKMCPSANNCRKNLESCKNNRAKERKDEDHLDMMRL